MNALALAGSDRSLVATPATERRKRERSLSRFRCDSRGKENKMLRISRATLIFMTTLTILVHPQFLTPARAAGPQDRVQHTLAAVSAVLKDPALQAPDSQPERRRRVQTYHLRYVPFRRDGPGVVGAHWDRLTPSQQEEFVRLFGHLFESSYNRLVLRFLGDRKATFDGEAVDGDHAVVRTTLSGGKEEQLSVEYQLASKQGRWGVVDVRIDGVSLAMNYRAQFNKILRTASYEHLVVRMTSKVEK